MGARLKSLLLLIDGEDVLLVGGGLLILSSVLLLLDFRWAMLALGLSMWTGLIIRRRR